MSEVRTLTIDENTAKQLYELFRNCESADTILFPCQDKLFRQHIKGCYQAANVQKAFALLAAFLESKGG